MILVSLNLVLVLSIYKCAATSVVEDILTYFKENRDMQETWRKYKRGIESSLEQMLQENYDAKSMNVYLRRSNDNFKLTEGFLEDSDRVVEVLFRDVYLMELPKMRYPKVSFLLASNLLKLDTELTRVNLIAKYMVFRNDSVIVYTNDKKKMLNVSPFSLQQVDRMGEVTIIGEECRLRGHAMTTLTDQSVNLGHNTFSLHDCKFKLEIWTPGEGSPPVFAPYFNSCDGGFLQNLVSKALQDELMTKLQGGLYSFVNSSEIFGETFARMRENQENLFKKVNNHMTETVNNLNTLTTNQNQGVANLNTKELQWTESVEGSETNNVVVITNTTLYGLDTAYSAQTGGPEDHNGTVYVEDVIGFSSLQVRGVLTHTKNNAGPAVYKFSAEIQDLSVVISLAADEKELRAAGYPSRGRQAWYNPRYRTFELNHYEVNNLWSRSLLTAYITNELYTAVIKAILRGQLNKALSLSLRGSAAPTSQENAVGSEDEKVEIVEESTAATTKTVGTTGQE